MYSAPPMRSAQLPVAVFLAGVMLLAGGAAIAAQAGAGAITGRWNEDGRTLLDLTGDAGGNPRRDVIEGTLNQDTLTLTYAFGDDQKGSVTLTRGR